MGEVPGSTAVPRWPPSTLLDPDNVSRCAILASLTVEELLEREPKPEVEYASRRAYKRLRRSAA